MGDKRNPRKPNVLIKRFEALKESQHNIPIFNNFQLNVIEFLS